MITPMMQQYFAAKAAHPEGLLFFRMGDFYELFHADAERAAALLSLTLTSRAKGEGAIPMAGVPVRAMDGYINRLVRMGEKVVICDQTQDAAEAKGLVERAVTRVITPGTVVEEGGLDARDASHLCALALVGDVVGIATADLSTGEFRVEECAAASAMDALRRLEPRELLLPDSVRDASDALATLLAGGDAPRTTLPEWRFDADAGQRLLLEHFGVARLEGLGLAGLHAALGATGALLFYLRETQKGAVAHLKPPRRVVHGDQLVLDREAVQALELVATRREGERKGSLLALIDETRTPAGARLLKRWMLEPLAQCEAIRERQSGVAELVAEDRSREVLRQILGGVQDMERLIGRLALGRAGPREMVALRCSLGMMPKLRGELAEAYSTPLRAAAEELPDLSALAALLIKALQEEVPPTTRDGGFICTGYDPELDELRAIGGNSRDWMLAYQATEQERTGIPSLKVAYNSVFGFYIEVTHVHSARVPAEYVRKQTVKNAERYITAELKREEERVLGAEERILERELEHFARLRERCLEALPQIQQAAAVVARVDALQSLAECARKRRWCRPEVDDSRDLDLREARHPVVEALGGAAFVPNDLKLLAGTRELALITGPNMAGKSTFIRQTALLVVLAQMGSYVPAAAARVGVVDRVFTRIGASDELARGNSTFMVEMIETAAILNSATARSLVILDEVGRGTSTFDGLAIAWAITEHLANTVHARTLFATHYHHLIDVAAALPNACNLNVAVREWRDEIVFLHRIIEGGSDRSYGIHVARLAGVPRSVVQRSKVLLDELEREHASPAQPTGTGTQLGLFAPAEDMMRRDLKALDIDRLTPLQALQELQRLKDLANA